MEVFEAKVGAEAAFPWKPLVICPIGDIQYSGKGGPCDLDRLERHLKDTMRLGAYYIGMGDYSDFPSPSNRRRLLEAGLYDTASDVIDRAAGRLEEELMEVLAPTRGRWLGLVEGHHWFQHLDGTTTGQRFARFLDCTYGGDSMMIRFTFRDNNHAVATSIFVHHGHGGSSTLSGMLPKLERFAARNDAQVFFIGHGHTLRVSPFDQLRITERGAPKLIHRTRAIVETGSFLKGWMQGSSVGGIARGHYPEQKLLPPVTLGAPTIIFTPGFFDSHTRGHPIVTIHGSF